MEKVSAVSREKEIKEAIGLQEIEVSVQPSSQKQKRIELGVMVGAGIVAGMMLSFALCGSLVNLGGMMGGGLTGLLMYYFS